MAMQRQPKNGERMGFGPYQAIFGLIFNAETRGKCVCWPAVAIDNSTPVEIE